MEKLNLWGFFPKIRIFVSLILVVMSKIWWILPILFMGMVFLAFYLGKIPIQGASVEERGQFGDSFGVLNSLFTGLGFGGIVVTLILQQRQIAQQEIEIKNQRQSEEMRHYEDTLHKLLALYTAVLADVSKPSGDLRGRSVLRGSIDRAFEAIKKEKAQLVPIAIQERYISKQLTKSDNEFLDYLYFRNFKILTVEIDRQGRLVETLKMLLHHLINEVPGHLSVSPYRALVCSQITHVEISYFFLVALTFKNEDLLRGLLLSSGLLEKAAYIKRLKVHDYMYESFWGVCIGDYKKPVLLPISEYRINNAINTFRRKMGSKSSIPSKIYTSPRLNGGKPSDDSA